MSDEEFKSLDERVIKGKAFLEGKWSSADMQVREWIRVWMDLAWEHFHQRNLRGDYKIVPSFEEMKIKQEETLDRAREQMIKAGIISGRRRRRK